MSTNEQIMLLWLRDPEGNYYALTEDQIRANRATPEQQAELEKVIGDVDVIGYVNGLAPVGDITLNIVVAPQIQTQNVFNVVGAAFAPVTQIGSNTGLQGLGIGQSGPRR
jgi:hypothetical protein